MITYFVPFAVIVKLIAFNFDKNCIVTGFDGTIIDINGSEKFRLCVNSSHNCFFL